MQLRRFGSKIGGRGMVWAGARWRLVTKFVGGATVLRMGYKTMLRAERAEFFGVSTQNCDIFEVH